MDEGIMRVIETIDRRLEPLTDEQIIEIWKYYAGDTKLTVLAFARAIEKEHGIQF